MLAPLSLRANKLVGITKVARATRRKLSYKIFKFLNPYLDKVLDEYRHYEDCLETLKKDGHTNTQAYEDVRRQRDDYARVLAEELSFISEGIE